MTITDASSASIAERAPRRPRRITAPAGEPIFSLVETQHRLEDEYLRLHEIADRAFFALPKEVKERYYVDDEGKFDLPIVGALYRESERANRRHAKVFDKVKSTIPTTLAGVIARGDCLDEFDEITLAALHAIERREAAEDQTIRDLFGRWREASRSLDLLGHSDDDDARDRLVDHRVAIFRTICDTPAACAVGLSIKAFLLAHLTYLTAYGTRNENVGALDRWNLNDIVLKRMVEDAARFVPELAKPAELLIKAPIVELVEFDDSAAELPPMPARDRATERRIADLPFVGETGPKADPRDPCSFWCVNPAGDNSKDIETGEQYALEFLRYQAAAQSHAVLQWVVRDMPRKLGQMEVAFLSIVDTAAKYGLEAAECQVAFWNRCRATEKEAEAERLARRWVRLAMRSGIRPRVEIAEDWSRSLTSCAPRHADLAPELPDDAALRERIFDHLVKAGRIGKIPPQPVEGCFDAAAWVRQAITSATAPELWIGERDSGRSLYTRSDGPKALRPRDLRNETEQRAVMAELEKRGLINRVTTLRPTFSEYGLLYAYDETERAMGRVDELGFDIKDREEAARYEAAGRLADFSAWKAGLRDKRRALRRTFDGYRQTLTLGVGPEAIKELRRERDELADRADHLRDQIVGTDAHDGAEIAAVLLDLAIGAGDVGISPAHFEAGAETGLTRMLGVLHRLAPQVSFNCLRRIMPGFDLDRALARLG